MLKKFFGLVLWVLNYPDPPPRSPKRKAPEPVRYPPGTVHFKDLSPGDVVHCETETGSRYRFTAVDLRRGAFTLVADRGRRRYRSSHVVFVASIAIGPRMLMKAFAPDCTLWYNDMQAPDNEVCVRTSPAVRIFVVNASDTAS